MQQIARKGLGVHTHTVQDNCRGCVGVFPGRSDTLKSPRKAVSTGRCTEVYGNHHKVKPTLATRGKYLLRQHSRPQAVELTKQLEIPGTDPKLLPKNNPLSPRDSPTERTLPGRGRGAWFQTFFSYIVLSRNYVTIPPSKNKFVPGTGWGFKRNPALKPQPGFGHHLSAAVRCAVGLQAHLGMDGPSEAQNGILLHSFQ